MTSPGQRLRILIDDLGLDQNKLAEKLNVTRQTINYIVNDRQPVSRDMATRLARLSGHTPGYWLQFEFADGTGTPPGDTGASVLVDDQIKRMVHDGILTITPFDPALVQAASIDLTLGELVMPAGRGALTIGADRPYDLGPGEVVNLRTRETLRFPHDHLGRVGAMASVSRFAIFMAHGLQVDPGYEGELEFCLYNAGVRSYPLILGAPIITLEIERLGSMHSGGKTAMPHDRREVEDHLAPAALALFAKWIASRVRVSPDGTRHVASISDLNSDISAPTEQDARDGKVKTELEAFRASCRHVSQQNLSDSYRGFFVRHAAHLYLDHDEARGLALALGLKVEGSTIALSSDRHMPLPQGPGEIALETIAQRLGEPVDKLILALAQSLSGEGDGVVAPWRPHTARMQSI